MPESKSRMRSKEYNLNPTEAQTGGRFRRGKMAPRIHTRVTERGRVSRREARFNHRTGSAATEGEREREGERVREIERRGECMREAPEKGAGASNGRAISQDAEPTPAACDIAPFTRGSFTTLHTHTHTSPLSLSLSLAPPFSIALSHCRCRTGPIEPLSCSAVFSLSLYPVDAGFICPFRSCEPPVRLLCVVVSFSLSLILSSSSGVLSFSFAAFSFSSIVFRMRFALEKPFQRTSFRITSSRDDSHCRRFLTVRELRAFALGERTQIASKCNLFKSTKLCCVGRSHGADPRKKSRDPRQ